VQLAFQELVIREGHNANLRWYLEGRDNLNQRSNPAGFPSDLPDAFSVLGRGLRKTCPHCGLGPLFKGWGGATDRCSHCGLVYERNSGDTWAFTIVGDRLPVAAAIVLVYFGVGAMTRAATAVVLVALGLLLIWTSPNRWGVGIALHYLSRRRWPDPADPLPDQREDSRASQPTA